MFRSVVPADSARRDGMASARRRWWGAGIDLMFPPDCAACGAELPNGSVLALCDECRMEMVDQLAACPSCGAATIAVSAHGTCPHCSDQTLHFQGVVRLGNYRGALRQSVLRMKHERERPLAAALGGLLAHLAHDRLAALDADAVVPVPMHWSRRLLRGVNSPQVIAERLARGLRLPVASGLLVRRRRTAPQAELTAAQRMANVRGAFRARRHPDLAGARLILVDDVMTTGATVGEAAKTLRRGGAAFVTVAVLARA